MKMLIKEIEGDGCIPTRTRRLSFKEFCQYVYEPSQRIKALSLPDKEEHELRQIIQERPER